MKIIEYLAGALKDSHISVLGNVMRTKRNTDFYSGGIEITGKETAEYIRLAEKTLQAVKKILKET